MTLKNSLKLRTRTISFPYPLLILRLPPYFFSPHCSILPLPAHLCVTPPANCFLFLFRQILRFPAKSIRRLKRHSSVSVSLHHLACTQSTTLKLETVVKLGLTFCPSSSCSKRQSKLFRLGKICIRVYIHYANRNRKATPIFSVQKFHLHKKIERFSKVMTSRLFFV